MSATCSVQRPGMDIEA